MRMLKYSHFGSVKEPHVTSIWVAFHSFEFITSTNLLCILLDLFKRPLQVDATTAKLTGLAKALIKVDVTLL